MFKLKKITDLICPECGKNEPVFFSDFELRGWPIMSAGSSNAENDNPQYYDLDIEYDIGYMASSMDEAIIDGYARCECACCGTEIPYFEDIKDEIEHSGSTE